MKRLLAASLIGLAIAGPLRALPGWRSLASDSFRVLYPAEREADAREALAALEQARPHVQSIVGGRTRRVTVVIQDLGIESNGLTDSAFHRILLFPTAPGAGDLSFHESWWRLVGVHEYTHWQHLSARGGLPGLAVALAGTWAAPGNATPSWLTEGICVYAESGLSSLEGRLNEGTYEAILASLARAGKLPGLVEATFQPLGFPGAGTSVRLLGGSFFAYLARTYGPEALPRFFGHFASSGWSYVSPLLPWAGIDRSARTVFGKGVRELWLAWQLDLIARYPPDGAAQPEGGWSVGAAATWRGAVYQQRQRPVKAAAFDARWTYELVRYDGAGAPEALGAPGEVLYRTTSPFHGPLRVREGKLYFAVQELRPGYANREFGSYGYEAVLYALDLESPRSRPRRVLQEPFRSFEVLPGGAVLLSRDRADAFGSEIRVLTAWDRRSRPLAVSGLRVEELLHDGSRWLYLSARREGANPGLYRGALAAGALPGPGAEPDAPPGPGTLTGPGAQSGSAAQALAELAVEQILDTPYAERDICLGGELLLFSANWNGSHGLYAWQAGDGSVSALSAAEPFAVAPALLEDRVWFTGLSARGYPLRSRPLERAPVQPPHALPAVAPTAPAPAAPAGEPAAGASPAPLPRRSGYLYNLGSLVPRALIPVFGFDALAGTWQAGAVLAGRSVLGDFLYTAGAYYDSDSGRPELSAYLESQALPPLQLTVSFATSGADELRLTLLAPLYRSLRPGFSGLAVGLGAVLFEDDYSRRALEPQLQLGLRFPRMELQSTASLSVERAALGSSQEDLALLATLRWRQLLFGGQLGLTVAAVHDFDGLAWTLPPPRGYADGLPAQSGALVSAEISLPLLRLRGGLWNPAVYFEDLFLAPFFDLAVEAGGALQWSAGAALHLEIKALAQSEGVPLDLSLGVALTREAQAGVLVGLQMPLAASPYGRVRLSAARCAPRPPR